MAKIHKPTSHGNSLWLADLILMRKKGVSHSETLRRLREGYKVGMYPDLSANFARDNLRFYGIEE